MSLFLVHFLEALVEREVVSNGVLPSSGSILEVGEVSEYPVVDVFNGQLLAG